MKGILDALTSDCVLCLPLPLRVPLCVKKPGQGESSPCVLARICFQCQCVSAATWVFEVLKDSFLIDETHESHWDQGHRSNLSNYGSYLWLFWLNCGRNGFNGFGSCSPSPRRAGLVSCLKLMFHVCIFKSHIYAKTILFFSLVWNVSSGICQIKKLKLCHFSETVTSDPCLSHRWLYLKFLYLI